MDPLRVNGLPVTLTNHSIVGNMFLDPVQHFFHIEDDRSVEKGTIVTKSCNLKWYAAVGFTSANEIIPVY